MNAPVIVDLRNIYDPKDMTAKGFAYSCIGRPVPSA
jgi:UDPglucose 6-dehydrogenase